MARPLSACALSFSASADKKSTGAGVVSTYLADVRLPNMTISSIVSLSIFCAASGKVKKGEATVNLRAQAKENALMPKAKARERG